jgi:hypothetical protein
VRRLSLLWLGVFGVAGCGSVTLPEAGDTHPASPAAAEAPMPRPSRLLDVEGPNAPAKPPPAAPVALYTCPMHPEVVSKTPGKCPKCGMALVPKKAGEEKK